MAFKSDAIFWVEVNKVVPNPFQPRKEFDEARLKELAESIRQYGVLQPLTVTRKEIQKEDGGIAVEYELIAGERRLRASRLAGLEQVPVLIRDGAENDRIKLELAIIENLQREDLNAIDRALAFKQLADQFELTHVQVAQKVGRSREYVSNTLRLLQLPEEMQQALGRGDITEGHARALLMLNNRPEEQNVLFRETMLKKLSVREVERLTRKIAVEKVRKQSWLHTNPVLIDIEKQLTDVLGTRVQISTTDYGGKVVIDYFSPEDLNKLLTLVTEERARLLDGVVARVAAADVVHAAPAEVEPAEALAEAIATEVATEPTAEEKPIDDRSHEERHEEDDTDLYAVRNFSL